MAKKQKPGDEAKQAMFVRIDHSAFLKLKQSAIDQHRSVGGQAAFLLEWALASGGIKKVGGPDDGTYISK